MASMNISMPESMRKFVLARAKQTSHATPTEYIRTLIREDKKRSQKLEDLLLEGINSEPIEITDESLSRLTDEMQARINRVSARQPRRRSA